jgi:hypothetical protein
MDAAHTSTQIASYASNVTNLSQKLHNLAGKFHLRLIRVLGNKHRTPGLTSLSVPRLGISLRL